MQACRFCKAPATNILHDWIMEIPIALDVPKPINCRSKVLILAIDNLKGVDFAKYLERHLSAAGSTSTWHNPDLETVSTSLQFLARPRIGFCREF